MKRTILLALMVITVIFLGCDKDPTSPKKPESMIRLKTGSGLRTGAYVYYMALSKSNDFRDTSNIFDYDKTEADWYIDGSSVPFTTDYKKFTEPVGEYYFLLQASGVAMMSRIEVKEGIQTWLIHARNGNLDIDMEQP